MQYAILAIIAIGAIFLIGRVWKSSSWKKPIKPFPADWRKILSEKIGYYNAMNPEDRKLIEFKIQEFLHNVKIIGVDTDVNSTDRILVAVSAVAPIFAFPKWQYVNLKEVLLYPNSFNEQYQTEGNERNILGMVGTGAMQGKMILSKQALESGYENGKDKHNTAIHEFVHLLDKADGATDGIPKLFLEQENAEEWTQMVTKEINAILNHKSDINPYGATNMAEFFAVSSEYFFERPKLLADKHPELYRLLAMVFHNDMQNRESILSSMDIGRNDDCSCGSGEKYKHCCGD